jgi:two-component system OmpR family sensor kinase
MKKSNRKFAFLSIIITTVLSSVIGGFATVESRNADMKEIDQSINLVAERVNQYSNEAISAAILTIEEENLDLTLALITQEGIETVINESHLIYPGLAMAPKLQKGIAGPISMEGDNPFRFRSVLIPGGDYLVIAATLDGLNANFNSNLKNLGGFTIAADALAIFFSIFFLRRYNRGLDAKALERMQRFLGDASHELRTPLTVIKGYNELLSKGQITDLVDRVRAFSRVSTEIERMESLIHDLLLLAELGESKPTTFEEVDLSELVSAQANDFAFLNKERKLNLNISDALSVQGSREHLNRLIQNCISNIIRHAPSSAPVVITLRSKGKKANLIIEDGGPGLPESAYRREIAAMNRFDPSRSRESGGSGLGMSIIAAIVQEHGGKLDLRKSELGGLAVDVELPN